MKKLIIALIAMFFVLSVYAQEEEQPAEETAAADDKQSAEDILQPAENIPSDEGEQTVDEESPVKEKKHSKTKKKKSKDAVNQNVPGEINKWMLNIGTDFVGVSHMVDVATVTTIGLPFTATSLAAGYQLSSQIWLMAKFHLFMTLVNDSASACFLVGPGIRADFIRTDDITFFGEFFLSLGNEAKTFLFSPELFLGIDYNVKSYLSIGIFTSFAYQLKALHIDEEKDPTGTVVIHKEDTITNHYINFMLGPRLSVFF
ncbi:MAG TPA: hypothetical protein PKG52_11545 [bacterium]|nr:hypothetical protein [bacterium]HPS28887.1 hypothetical protein [bacterium]